MNIGAAVTSLRVNTGLSQKELSEMVGICQCSLSHIETNKKNPHKSTLKKIAEALNVPIEFLMFMAMEESDIPESGKAHFNRIEREIKKLIRESCSTPNTKQER